MAYSDLVAKSYSVLPIIWPAGGAPVYGPVIDVSVQSFIIAADSDVDTLVVLYPDPLNPIPQPINPAGVGRSITVVGPGAVFPGAIIANPTQGALGLITINPGRFFATPVSSYFGADPQAGVPFLKAFAFTKNPVLTPVKRDTKPFNRSNIITTPGLGIVGRFPFWGRNLFSAAIGSDPQNGDITVKVRGHNFSMPNADVVLYSNTFVAPGPFSVEVSIVNQRFDAIEIVASSTAGGDRIFVQGEVDDQG
jgi:hypothetical protein